MPTVSVANFDNEELLSTRLLSFMTNNDHSPTGFDPLNINANGNGFVSSTNFASTYSITPDADYNSVNFRSSLCRNGSIPAMNVPQERIIEATAVAAAKESSLTLSSSMGLVSGSCTPPPTFIPSTVGNYIQRGAPSHSALTSPCLGNKLSTSVTPLLNYNGERHSLQNSPFYNQYSLAGNVSGHINRHFNGASPSNLTSILTNGTGNLCTSPRNGTCQDTMFPGSSSRSSSSGCPQRELFPTVHSNQSSNSQNVFGSGLHMQDRLYYHALATKYGFIVGPELERVKDNSCRSTSQSYGRIAAHFRNRYGETEAKTKAAYLQIGVRVPSKDHVSEIVGKGGQKIKLIREETGALITTPGEHEEHVFIIEAPPEIAMRVAHHLTTRAHEITQSKLVVSERRRGSTSSQQQQALNGGGLLETAFSTGTVNGNGCTTAGNGSTISTVPATAGFASPGGLLSITAVNASAHNSPLHPSVTTVASPPPPSSGQHQRSNGSSVAGGGLFPTSPSAGNVISLPHNGANGLASSGVLGTGGTPSASLFTSPGNGNSSINGPSTTGSRILLARGRISVPQEMVGKIIGTQGSIITTIQKDTGTEIKSPPKEAARGPNATSEFEISAYQGLGLNSNQAAECRVQQAKQLIGHLVMRQLERRASEEVEEIWTASGCNTVCEENAPLRANVSTGGCASSAGSSGSTPRLSSLGWMWPDVAQMDSQEAREVLDRILAESKNKTRRAKELAAAAAVSAGPSPVSSCSVLTPPGSSGPSHLSVVDHHHHPHQQQQLRHLLSATNLFGAGGCPLDVEAVNESIAGRNPPSAAAVAAAAAFNGNRHQYTVGGGLLERLHSAPSSSLPASVARTMSSNQNNAPNVFNMADPGDILSTFSRSPGTQIPSDPWNSEVSSPSGPFHSVLTGNSSINQSPFTSTGANSLEVTRRNTDFNQSFFDFNPSSLTSGSIGTTTTGDLSPDGFLLHHRGSHHQHLMQPASSELYRPMSHRHADWMTNSGASVEGQQLSELCGSSGTSAVTTMTTKSLSHFVTSSSTVASSDVLQALGGSKNQQSVGEDAFSSHSFDFIKALDQLCIGPTGEEQQMAVESVPPPPPPGFELHQQHRKSSGGSNESCPVFSSFNKLSNEDEQLVMFDHHQHHDLTGNRAYPWCNTSPNNTGGNDSSSGDDFSHPPSFSTSILLRSIFSNGGGGGAESGAYPHPENPKVICCSVSAASSPHLSTAAAAIWSQSAASGEDSRGITHSFNSDDRNSTTTASRCGTIGEGRRRRRDENSTSSGSIGAVEDQSPSVQQQQLAQQIHSVAALSTATEVA